MSVELQRAAAAAVRDIRARDLHIENLEGTLSDRESLLSVSTQPKRFGGLM